MSYDSPRNKPGERLEHIEILGDVFTFVRAQRGDASAVYRSKNAFMRIGKAEKILKDLTIHKTMEQAGFPIAKRIAEGEFEGESYFIEESLGEEHLGAIFANSVEKNGSIADGTFEEFVSLSEKYANALIKTDTGLRDGGTLRDGILLDTLCKELPEHAAALESRFEKVLENTKHLPTVLTHGDFNPNNLYPGGVIDLEDSFYAPYGYDLVSAITHINYFPDSKDYEYFAKYRFTLDQKKAYFERLDTVSTQHKLAPLSTFEKDFEFCRAVWLAAKIPHLPKLQQFRYTLLIDTFLR